MKMSTRWIRGVGVLALLASLQGCEVLLLSTLLVGGSMVATDRRSTGIQLEDEAIELRAVSRLGDALQGRGHLNVTSYNRVVLLTGEVPTDADRQLAEKTLAQVDNVRSSVNELAVMFSSTLAQRSNDSLLTSKAKAAIANEKNLASSAFKVVTEREVLYLMGRVTQREADLASEVVRRVAGVQRVIRVFEIISEDELQRIGATATASKPAEAKTQAPAPVSDKAPAGRN